MSFFLFCSFGKRTEYQKSSHKIMAHGWLKIGTKRRWAQNESKENEYKYRQSRRPSARSNAEYVENRFLFGHTFIVLFFVMNKIYTYRPELSQTMTLYRNNPIENYDIKNSIEFSLPKFFVMGSGSLNQMLSHTFTVSFDLLNGHLC